MNRICRPLCLVCVLWITGILMLKAAGAPLRRVYEVEPLLTEERYAVVTGRLSEVKSNSTGHYTVLLDKCRADINGGEYEAGTVRLYADERPDRTLGEELVFAGRLALPEGPDNPGEFDSLAYSRAMGITAELDDPEYLGGTGRTDSRLRLAECAGRLRGRLAASLDYLYEDGSRGVLYAVLLGDKTKLSQELMTLYETAGLSHLFSVSGMHVTLLASFAGRATGFLLSFIPWERMGRGGRGLLRRHGRDIVRLTLIGAGLMLYCELAGRGTALKRACVMYALGLGAACVNRSYDLLTALAAAALAVLIPHPLMLFQSSFVLSFGFVLLIGTVYPLLTGRFRVKSGAGKAILLGYVLQMGMLPFILMFFYEWHPYSALAGALMLPLMPFILGGGLISAALAYFLPAAGLFIAGNVNALIRLLTLFCRVIGHLPGSSLILGHPDPRRVCLYYLVLTAAVLKAFRKKRIRVLCVSLLAVLILVPARPDRLEITSLYVGQGDCHVVCTPEGDCYVLDGGRGFVSPADKMILPFLKYRGIGRLAGIAVSHLDEDHMNAVAELLGEPGLKTERLYLPAGAENTARGRELLAAAAREGVPVTCISAGAVWESGAVTFRILYPGEETVRDDNDSSLVLMVSMGAFDALFTGDLEEGGERALSECCGELLAETEYLKVPHHGSKSSSSEAFLNLVLPRAAVVSCGRNNVYRHPAEAVLARYERRGIPVYRTDTDGAVTLTANSDGSFEVRCFHERRYSDEAISEE